MKCRDCRGTGVRVFALKKGTRCPKCAGTGYEPSKKKRRPKK